MPCANLVKKDTLCWKLEHFVKFSPNSLTLLCKWLVVFFFPGTVPYLASPADALSLRMKNGHSCLLSLLPCHPLPCLAVIPLSAAGDPRNPDPSRSCWSQGRHSQPHDSHTPVRWSQAPGEEGRGSSPGSYGPFKTISERLSRDLESL